MMFLCAFLEFPVQVRRNIFQSNSRHCGTVTVPFWLSTQRRSLRVACSGCFVLAASNDCLSFPNLGYRGCTGVNGGCSGETGTTSWGLTGLVVDCWKNAFWIEHGWAVAATMQSRSMGAADSAASRISPAAAGLAAIAASRIHSANSQESAWPA